MYLFIDHAEKFGHLSPIDNQNKNSLKAIEDSEWFTIHTITHDKIGIHLLIFDAHF